MATATVTPPASAPAAAPAATPAAAPAAAPSTPAATETTTPTTTPAAPVETTPSEPQTMEERLTAGWKKAKDSVPLEEEEAAPEEEFVAAAPAEEAAPEAAAAPEGEEKPAPEAATEIAPADQWDLDDDGTAGDPAAFFNEANKNPEVKKFFDANQGLKNLVAGALRRDKENREIRQYIPDAETAQIVSKAAADYQTLDNHFLDATTPEGAQSFLDYWVREAMYLDDKGQPVMENGKYKLHPALTYTFDHIANNKLAVFADQVKTNGQLPSQLSPIVDALKSFAVTKGDERLQTVADILKEMMTPDSSAEGEVPPELKAHADRLKAKETALTEKEQADARQRQAEQRTAHLQSIDRAESKAVDAVKGQLKPRFDASGLSEFERNAALAKIGEQLEAKLGALNEDGSWAAGNHPSSRMFQSIYDSILRNNPPGEAREAKLSKHILTYTQQVLGPIVTAVIRDAKKGALDRQTEKQTTVDAQKHTSRTDPRGTSITTAAPVAQNPAELRAQVIKDLTASLGRDPEEREVIAEAWKRQQKRK